MHTIKGLLLAALLVPAASVASAQVKVTGKVVDAEGQPVAGAEVGPRWTLSMGQWKSYSGVATTAEDGTFSMSVRVYSGRKTSLYARSGKRGGFVLFTGKDTGKPQTIELSELGTVKGKITCKQTGEAPEMGNVWLCHRKTGTLLLSMSLYEGFSFSVPPGEYYVWAYFSGDYRGFRKNVTVTDVKTPVDLGTIDVKLSVIGSHYGKPLPAWTCTDARNLPKKLAAKGKGIKLSDYKGRWVLIEFWGYW